MNSAKCIPLATSGIVEVILIGTSRTTPSLSLYCNLTIFFFQFQYPNILPYLSFHAITFFSYVEVFSPSDFSILSFFLFLIRMFQTHSLSLSFNYVAHLKILSFLFLLQFYFLSVRHWLSSSSCLMFIFLCFVHSFRLCCYFHSKFLSFISLVWFSVQILGNIFVSSELRRVAKNVPKLLNRLLHHLQ